MSSVTRKKRDPQTGKLPSEPHTFVDGVEGKRCTGRYGGGEWCALSGFWTSPEDYEDGYQDTCRVHREEQRRLRAPSKPAVSHVPKYYRKHTVAPDTQALVPVAQYSDVPIHTGQGRGVRFEEVGALYVAGVDICAFFGVDSQGQYRRLCADPNYRTAIRLGRDISTQRGDREMWFICYDKVSGWLHLINPNKVKQDRRAGLIAYRDVCDKVLSDYMTGTKTAPPSPAWQPDEGGLRRVVREEVRAAFAEENKHLESRTLLHTIPIDRPIDGRVYIAEESRKLLQVSGSVDVLRRLERGWRYLFISETGRSVDERIKEYAKKRGYGVPVPDVRKVILSDRRKKLQDALHRNLPDGVWRVPGRIDEFMASPDAYEVLMALPSYIGATDIPQVHQWIVCASVFEVV